MGFIIIKKSRWILEPRIYAGHVGNKRERRDGMEGSVLVESSCVGCNDFKRFYKSRAG